MSIHTAKKASCFLVYSAILIGGAAGAQSSRDLSSQTVAKSAYTHLDGARCKVLRVDREGGSSEQLCSAIEGYKLLLLDSDNRMSVTVITPDGGKHPLEFWSTVTTHFSQLGKTAEWRITQGTVQALILPLKVNDDPNSAVATPYLVVVRLQGGDMCSQ